jgi:FkbM family methyltransferase
MRHSRTFENSQGLWNLVRPWYVRVLTLFERRGIRRMINGTDLVLLAHDLHGVPETYEPDLWRALMAKVRRGDTVADVGAFIGLYTVALARRVGAEGRVHAFEPDRASYSRLCQHVQMNGVSDRVRAYPSAVGAESTHLRFAGNRGSESTVATSSAEGAEQVEAVCLDSVFAAEPVDLLKIDVEGYEVHVLRGAVRLLKDASRAPRTIFVEVHPTAWERFGVTDRSLLESLWQVGYKVFDLGGNDVSRIAEHGAIVAQKEPSQ